MSGPIGEPHTLRPPGAEDSSAGQTVRTAETLPPARKRWLRYLVNAWLLFHLAAIISAPASVSPSSRLMQQTWELFRPYLQVLYLNHGYHFFAPEPSQSTLIAYSVQRPDGSRIVGQFPHRGIRPRLLYHRHFMLSEFLNFAPSDGERPWHRTYARHLNRTYDGQRTSLTRKTHYLPTMEAVVGGVRLDDPAGYEEQPLGVFAWEK